MTSNHTLSSKVSNSTSHSPTHLTTPRSTGLPSDEYRDLVKRQRRSQIESHLSHKHSISSCSTTTTTPHTPTPYQTTHLSPSHRLQISQVKNATRRALTPGFDFTDERYEQAQRRDTTTHKSRRYQEPIPQRYINEFNSKWARDDELYDAEQARADRVVNAAWRVHDGMRGDVAPLDASASSPPRGERRVHCGVEAVREQCLESGGCRTARPQLVSKFSTDSLGFEESKRGMFGFRSLK
ncbi:hypothetical protein IAQ61_009193 [Plenodomus lingam]|uniref:uncharacterized protein n=1 Tax=Leptosphaeria maculans TaxID=5022 RepID=UPI00332F8AF0|nr:hypothetical protein IAQ61_009193 [Plenodomus lingam]